MPPITEELEKALALLRGIHELKLEVYNLHKFLEDYFPDCGLVLECRNCGKKFRYSETNFYLPKTCQKCHNRLYGKIRVKKRFIINKYMLIKDGASEETAGLLRIIRKSHAETINLIKDLEILDLYSDLGVRIPFFNPHKAKDEGLMAGIFLYIKFKGTGQFQKDIKVLYSSTKKAIKLLNEEKIEFERIEGLLESRNALERSVAFWFLKLSDSEKGIIHILYELENSIERIQASPIWDEMQHLVARRISFSISPHSIDNNLYGKINIEIRQITDKLGIDTLKRTLFYFLSAIETFGSADKYYEALANFIRRSFEFLIKKNMYLFTDVYGNQIKCNFFLDVMFIEMGYSAFVKESIDFTKEGMTAKVLKYDAANRNIEIGLSIRHLVELVKENKYRIFIELIAHELGHIFDWNLTKILHSKIRAEGIAMFTENAMHDVPKSSYNKALIAELTSNPIDSEKELEMQSKRWHPSFPYLLGYYISLVFYLAFLKKRFKKLGMDVYITLENLNWIDMHKSYDKKIIGISIERANFTARFLRTLPEKYYFPLYLKYANELNIKPVLTKRYVNWIVRLFKK